jgi:glycosyltransferase involved in cell wall biosynthesis
MPAEDKRPVVVYHHRTQGVDAQGIHVHEVCRAFEALGYRVVKVALHAQEQVGSESRPGLVSRLVSRIPRLAYEFLELGYNLFGFVRLCKAVATHRPEFIYERYSLFNVSGVLAARLMGVPLAVEVNSPLAWEKSHHGGLVLKGVAQRMETFIVNKASLAIAVTGVLKRMLVDQGAAPGNIVVMPNGVNPEEYRDIPLPGQDAAEDVVLGFVGWFRPWHGLAEVIVALDEHGVFRRGAKLLLVGDGPARLQLESIIHKRNLDGRVTITGPVDRRGIFRYLAGMDVALQPASTDYASPMKLFEYLAAGKAVVAPDQENIREVVRDGEDALLFTPGDWEGFAKRVSELAGDSGLRRRLGEAGRRSIETRGRTWKANAARVADILGQVGSARSG